MAIVMAKLLKFMISTMVTLYIADSQVISATGAPNLGVLNKKHP
jgi:hypothetical protein